MSYDEDTARTDAHHTYVQGGGMDRRLAANTRARLTRYDAILDRAEAVGEDADTLKGELVYGRGVAKTEGGTSVPVIIGNGDRQRMHYLLGLVSEVGELVEAVRSKSDADAIEELGDILWFASRMAIALDTTTEEVQRLNIGKLRARYPERFTEERANNRNLEAESLLFQEVPRV
jgi:NTP pyrophosphatase (non-canonical NTP hydrolase)